MSGQVIAFSAVIAVLLCATPSHAELSDEVVTPVPVPTDKLRVVFEDIDGLKQGYGGYKFGFLQYSDSNDTGKYYRLCQSRKYFDQAGAALACNESGYYGGGVRLNESATVGIMAKAQKDNVGSFGVLQCSDTYTNFSQCTASPKFDHSPKCPTTDMVVLKCFEKGALRLVGGKTENEGRLQILAARLWWNTCSDYIIGVTADTACKLLGFPPSATKASSSDFDPNNSRYRERSAYLTYVSCSGTETTLDECISDEVSPVDRGNGTCYNVKADAALVCKSWPAAPPRSPAPSKDSATVAGAPAVVVAVAAALAAAMMLMS